MYIKRRTVGMSLIELLICITIVAVLASGAYLFYTDHVHTAREAVAWASMRKIVEAVQAYNADNAMPFTTSEPEVLVGPYLNEIPLDPWGNDFVVDFFFGRIISPGPDMELDTFCPFPLYYDRVRTITMSDDLILDYQRIGRLASVHSGGQVIISNADGDSAFQVTASGARSMSMVSEGSHVLYLDDDGNLHFVDMSDDYWSETTLPYPTGLAIGSEEDVDIVGVPGPSPGREVAFAPDGIRYAVIAQTSTMPTSSVVLVSAVAGDIPPFIPVIDQGRFTDVAWSADGRSLYLLNPSAYPERILVATASAGSRVSVFSKPVPDSAPAISNLAASRDGRFIAFDDGNNSHIMYTGRRTRHREVPDALWPTFSPDSRKLAFANEGEIYAIHLNFRPETRVQLSVNESAASVRQIVWD